MSYVDDKPELQSGVEAAFISMFHSNSQELKKMDDINLKQNIYIISASNHQSVFQALESEPTYRGKGSTSRPPRPRADGRKREFFLLGSDAAAHGNRLLCKRVHVAWQSLTANGAASSTDTVC